MDDKINDLENYKEQESITEDIPTLKRDIIDKSIDKSSDAIEQDLNSDLSWLSDRYREVTNTSRKDVRLWEVEDFRKFVTDNPVAEKVFQRLKDSWLKVYVNDKTDVSFTHEFSIIMWMSDSVTEQSKYTMNLDKNATAYDVQKRKFIHEMCHSLRTLQEKEWLDLFDYSLKVRKAKVSITKLWDLDRYGTFEEKAREDTVELLRMYIQDSDNFKTYLWQIFKHPVTVDIFYQKVENCINAVIKD